MTLLLPAVGREIYSPVYDYFMGLMGIYFVGKGERGIAKQYYAILKQMMPEHPLTKLLRRKLHCGSLTQMLRGVLA